MRLTIKLRNYAAVLMTIALSAIAVTSCSDSDSQQPDVYCTALVTYERSTPAPEGSDDNTATSYFTYYGENDAMPTTLTAKANMPSSMKQGQRCILSFIPNDFANPTATGMVELVRCLNVSTTTMQTAPAATAQAANAPINLLYTKGEPQIKRTGPYINIEAYMPYVEDRTYTIVADENSMQNAIPDLYLTTTASQPVHGITNTSIGSIDIQSIWRRLDIDGVRIHINNSNPNYPDQTVFEFRK